MSVRVAILDLYDSTENLGMASIERLVRLNGIATYDVFDVRALGEVPDLSYDIYLATGGPGNPLEVEDTWGVPFFGLLDKLWDFNHTHADRPKHVLFICHSFQMACHHFGIGEITKRKSESFGVFPAHLTEAGKADTLFSTLPDPFYVADFRLYQLLQPNHERLKAMGAEILALEKFRPHVPLERAIMAVRFSDTCLGVQFHPEAEAAGMIEHFYKKAVHEKALELKGEEKFSQMIEDLGDPQKLQLTYMTVIPLFLRNAIEKIRQNNKAFVT
jgi:GMP synthase-like glutamine amidotransferase